MGGTTQPVGVPKSATNVLEAPLARKGRGWQRQKTWPYKKVFIVIEK